MLVPSPSVFPSASLSSSPSATASLVAEDLSARDLAWQTAVYLAVVLGAVLCHSALTPGPSCGDRIPAPSPSNPSSLIRLVIVALISAVILIIWNDDWSWRAFDPGPGPAPPPCGRCHARFGVQRSTFIDHPFPTPRHSWRRCCAGSPQHSCQHSATSDKPLPPLRAAPRQGHDLT
ncbi:hypothetical protein BC827DRAFT_415910 [Russula dissimulans]|nr:hypothetical protein BC827DRAFT_415910 [Russula dissimulans]